MFKKNSLRVSVALAALAIAGCATGSNRNTDSEIGTLNSRVASMEGELSSKDQEIAKLREELDEQRARLAQAEADKQAVSEQLSSALAAAKASKVDDSDLK